MVDADPGPEKPWKQSRDRIAFISFDSKTAGRYLPSGRDQRRRAVRSQAAKSSAAIRKATLAKKAAAATKSSDQCQPLLPNPDCSIAHNAYHSQIWQDILSNRALYHATQLVIITVRGNFAGEQGPLDPHRRSIAWDRLHVARIIRATLASGNSRDVEPAVAVLAAWELRFGDITTSDAHVNAWKRLKDRNDTAFPSSVEQLPGVLDAIILAVLKAVRALAGKSVEESRHDRRKDGSSNMLITTSSETNLLQVHGVVDRPSSVAPDALPSGFHVFDLDQLDVVELRGFIRSVVNFDVTRENIVARLRQAVIPFIVWQPNELTVSRKPIDREALYCLRAVMIMCVGILTARRPSQPGNDLDIAEGLRLHIDYIARLDLDGFAGTKYQDMLVWTLTLCLALTGGRDIRMHRLLGGILHSRGIKDCSNFEAILRSFSYAEDIIGPMCRKLFEAVTEDRSAASSNIASPPTAAAAILQVPSRKAPTTSEDHSLDSDLPSLNRGVRAG